MYWYNQDIERLSTLPVVQNDKKKLVFYGSSSFTLWENLSTCFPAYNALNMGFGGSTLAACTWFFDKVIPRQRPDVLIIYAGDNDLGDGRTPEEVVLFFKQLQAEIQRTLPNIPVIYLSIKWSPARKHLKGSIVYANQCIREHIAAGAPTYTFLDIHHPMLDDQGEINPIYYQSDGLHLSTEGYTLWQTLIQEQLHTLGLSLPEIA